jgi:hypothetical protein
MSEISSSTVTIRLFGAELDPNHVTQLLSGTPSAAAKKGEKIIKPDGRERIVKRGFWRLEYGERDEIGLEEKIEILLAKLTNNLESWQDVTRNIEIADIYCGLFIDHWNEGFTLSPSIMRKISDRNLTIGFDIYSPTDTWYRNNEESEMSEEST